MYTHIILHMATAHGRTGEILIIVDARRNAKDTDC